MINRLVVLLLVVLTAGCTAIAVRRTDARFGPQSTRDRVAASGSVVTLERDVAPIFNRRCLVCHACYDAPCELKDVGP
jgi:hypothetical protein